MALVELQAGLPTGLTLSAKFFSGGALALTQALTESPAGSGNYCYPTTIALMSGTTYSWVIVDGSGSQYAVNDGPVTFWNGLLAQTANIVQVNGEAPVTSGIIPPITPLSSSIAQPLVATTNFNIFQYSAPVVQWTITSGGNPVDLSGDTVRFVAYLDNGVQNLETFAYDNATEGGLTIGGAGNNVISVQFNSANTQSCATDNYTIWNVTSDIPLASGVLGITRNIPPAGN